MAVKQASRTFASKINVKDLERKIRVGAVSYLNTKPLLYGIEKRPFIDTIELVKDYPSHIAQMLLDDKIDVGLVPVAIIPRLKNYFIKTDFCIGCDGPVASVCIFSEVPLQEVEVLLLDYQSTTSVHLAKILLRGYWKLSIRCIDTSHDFRDQIKGKTAGLVIGDRALEQRKISSFIYDLGEAWKQYTGLSFVFAAWISNKELPAGFLSEFNIANEQGLNHFEEVIETFQESPYDLNRYYRENIKYSLTENMRNGLFKFINLLQKGSLTG